MGRHQGFSSATAATVAVGAALFMLATGFTAAAQQTTDDSTDAPPGTRTLARYLPLRHGQAWLERWPTDHGTRWISGNVHRIPVTAVGEWGPAALTEVAWLAGIRPANGTASATLTRLTALDGAEDRLQLFEMRYRSLDPGADPVTTVQRIVRKTAGDWLVSTQVVGKHPLVYHHPLQQFPAHLAVGSHWASTSVQIEEHEPGTTTNVPPTTVGMDGTVLRRGPRITAAGSFRDCLQVQLIYAQQPPGRRSPTSTVDYTWYCAGLGNTAHLVSASTQPVPAAAQLPSPDTTHLQAMPPAGDGSGWATHPAWAAAGPPGLDSEATFTPVYVPLDDPVVLAASQVADLRALSASHPSSLVWRFAAGGPVYTRPLVDPAHDRLFFGSTDKRVYALTTQGLYLWSFPTGDALTARPLVVGDLLVVAGEDGLLYGRNATTGLPAWPHPLDLSGAVVSDPAAVGPVVAVVTEDGAVHGLDTRRGTVADWADAGGPVTAAVTADAHGFYVLSTNGMASRLRPDGSVAWQAELDHGQDSDPVLHDGTLFMVDAAGALTRLNTRNRTPTPRPLGDIAATLVGPPVVTDLHVFVQDTTGAIYQVDRRTGHVIRRWPAPTQPASALGQNPARLGLADGAGLWWADWRSVVHHIGGDDGR